MALRIAAVCGILSPVLSTIGWLVAGFVQPPGYDAVSEDISDLGAHGAAHPWILNLVGSNMAGALAFVFALGLLAALSGGGPACSAGPAIVAVFGAGEFVDGFLRLDCESRSARPACPGNESWQQAGHVVESVVTALAMLLAPAVCGWCFRRRPHWARLAAYSFATTGLVLALMAGYGGVAEWGDSSGAGVLQRLFATAGVLWIGVVAARLLALERASPTTRPRRAPPLEAA